MGSCAVEAVGKGEGEERMEGRGKENGEVIHRRGRDKNTTVLKQPQCCLD